MNTVRFSRVFLSLFGSALIVIALLLFLLPFGVQAGSGLLPAGVTRYVSPSGDDAANACTNNNSPCRTVQHAVDVSQASDEIRVAQGTYTGTMSTPGTIGPFTATILITKNLDLFGGYSSDFSQRDPQIFTSTLDGEFRAWSVVGLLGSRSTLDGFSIINGHSPNGGGMWIGNWTSNSAVVTVSNNLIAYNHTITDSILTADGAGILVTDGATANILNNRIESNVIEASDGAGAGISVQLGATAVIKDNKIGFNTTPFSGGGINVYTATAQIVDNDIQDNSEAGVNVWNSPSVLMQGNTVVSNTTVWNGGGIRAGESVVTFTDNLIAYNAADEPSGGVGGGIFLWSNTHGVIEQNEVYSNISQYGGGIGIGSGPAVITGNVIIANVADMEGGGIFVDWNAPASIVSNTIAYNQAISTTAGRGGGVRTLGDSAVVTISHNEIYSNALPGGGGSGLDIAGPAIIDSNHIHHNQVVDWGGGVLIADVTQPVTLTNNVIAWDHNTGIEAINFGDLRIINNTVANNSWGNIAVFAWPVIPPNPFTTTILNNIIVSGGGCGVDAFNGATVIIDYNDLYQNQPDYCGLADPPSGIHNISADPQFVNPSAGNYHIRFGSPAMNTGTSTNAPGYDKDGVKRPQMGRVDIGAYEVVAPYSVYLPIILK